MNIETFTYLVVFNSKTQKYDGPILFEANGNGTMHLFDDEMYSIFDALEFVMHIAILKEMLAEEGMEGKFDNILSQNDFFPESFFYQFLGSPENVFLYSEIFGKYIHRNMQNSD